MISTRTEQKLANLYNQFIEGERKSEISRQLLNENLDFEPQTAFQRIDQSLNGYISQLDFNDFLSQNQIHLTTTEASQFFRHLDVDNDGRISLSEFLQLTLSKDNDSLALRAQKRAPFSLKNNKLPFEAELLLTRVFEQELRNLRNFEDARRDLTTSYDYESLNLYNQIDDSRKAYISTADLQDLLIDYGYSGSSLNITYLLRRVDRDGDNKIVYSEFLESILPIYSRQSTQFYSPQKRETLLESELRHSIRHHSPRHHSPRLIRYSRSPRHYNPYYYNYYPYIYRSFYHHFSPSRRLLEEQELVDYLARSQLDREIQREKRRSQSPLRKSLTSNNLNNNNNLNGSVSGNNLGNSLLRNSVSNSNQQYQTPQKNDNQLEQSQVLRGSQLRQSQSRSPARSPMKYESEEIELVRVLKQQVELDREVEKKKNDLSLKIDFNLLDCFRLLDQSQKGYIQQSEFKDSLNYNLGIFCTREEVYLIFKRFDSDQDGLLKYSDFVDIFAPRSEEYKNLLLNRPANYYESLQEFSLETRVLIKNLFRQIIENEDAAEKLRQRLSKRPLFSLHEAFRCLDSDNDGFITKEEFKLILNDYGIFMTNKEINNLMSRYDKKQMGKVSYSDFVSEIVPKTPQKI